MHDKIFLALAYPFVCCMFCGVDLSLCDDHQFIDVSRCEKYSWSTGRWWLCCIAVWAGFRFWAFLLGLWAMYCLAIGLYFRILSYFNMLCYWHRGVPSFSPVFF